MNKQAWSYYVNFICWKWYSLTCQLWKVWRESMSQRKCQVFLKWHIWLTLPFLQRGVDGSKGGLMKALLLVPCVNRWQEHPFMSGLGVHKGYCVFGGKKYSNCTLGQVVCSLWWHQTRPCKQVYLPVYFPLVAKQAWKWVYYYWVVEMYLVVWSCFNDLLV